MSPVPVDAGSDGNELGLLVANDEDTCTSCSGIFTIAISWNAVL